MENNIDDETLEFLEDLVKDARHSDEDIFILERTSVSLKVLTGIRRIANFANMFRKGSPIDTAPKDGNTIIVYGGTASDGIRESENNIASIARWKKNEGRLGWWIPYSGYYAIEITDPVAWGPVPCLGDWKNP